MSRDIDTNILTEWINTTARMVTDNIVDAEQKGIPVDIFIALMMVHWARAGQAGCQIQENPKKAAEDFANLIISLRDLLNHIAEEYTGASAIPLRH